MGTGKNRLIEAVLTNTGTNTLCFSKLKKNISISHLKFINFNCYKRNRKAINRNWSNQKANPALKTKAENK